MCVRKGLMVLCAGIFMMLNHVSTAEAGRYPITGRSYSGGGGSRGMTTPSPVEWSESLKQAQESASAEKPIYLFFSRKDCDESLPGQFRFNKEMQRISKEDAVFVRVEISKKATKEERELLKKYKVSKPGTAVLADQHGNYVAHAESRYTKKLGEQIKKACKLIAHKQKLMDDRLKKGEAALKEGDQFMARYHFKLLVDKFDGHKEAETAAGHLGRLAKKKTMTN